MKALLATAAVSVLLLAACGTAGGSGTTTVNTNARTVSATLSDSKIVLDQSTVPSGKITFNVKNAGTMVHEVVVLKTNVAAHFPSRKFGKGEGAGLYIEVAPQWVWIGGGMYMPEPAELYAIRARIATDHRKLHRIATSREFKSVLGGMSGEQLTRVPRGYPKDHPAAEYLRHKQFLGFREYPAEFALSPRFYPELLKVFKALTPLVNFLNDAILKGTRGRGDRGTRERYGASGSSSVP